MNRIFGLVARLSGSAVKHLFNEQKVIVAEALARAYARLTQNGIGKPVDGGKSIYPH